MKKEKRPACLICKREERSRGLCAACNMAVSRKIKDGTLNEAEAIRRGLLLPVKRSKFSEALELSRSMD